MIIAVYTKTWHRLAEGCSMKFFLDDLPILFPYEFIYPEQYAYMKDIKKALDAKVNESASCQLNVRFVGPLLAGDAFWDGQDDLLIIADCSLSAILSRKKKTYFNFWNE